jgi:hypothetical protein
MAGSFLVLTLTIYKGQKYLAGKKTDDIMSKNALRDQKI